MLGDLFSIRLGGAFLRLPGPILLPRPGLALLSKCLSEKDVTSLPWSDASDIPDCGRAISDRGRAISGRERAISGRGRAISGRGRAFSGRGRAISGRGRASEIVVKALLRFVAVTNPDRGRFDTGARVRRICSILGVSKMAGVFGESKVGRFSLAACL